MKMDMAVPEYPAYGRAERTLQALRHVANGHKENERGHISCQTKYSTYSYDLAVG
jgi:hypothetical protein